MGRPPDWIVRRRRRPCPAGSRHFPELTVEENLQAGAYVRKDHGAVWNDVQRWLEFSLGSATEAVSPAEARAAASSRCWRSRGH